MEECLIDISIDEPISTDSSVPTLRPEAHSSVLDHSSLQDQLSLRDRISASLKRDEERYKVLEDLLNENEALKAENMALKSQLTAGGQATNATLWGKQNASPQIENLTQVEGLTQQLRDAQLSMGTAPFVLVLIDGNAHTFEDSLLRGRAAGGSEAGLVLRDEINCRIYQKYGTKDWKIVTKLYLDIEGLAARHTSPRLYPVSALQKYVEGQTGRHTSPRLHNVSALRDFFAGFTQVQSTFDVVDTGHDPHEMLELFVENVQCKHIFYACAPDAASLATLDAYRDNFITASSITLIKSKPFKSSELFLPFEIIELPSLFRVDQEQDDEEVLGGAQNRLAERHERPRTTVKTMPGRLRGGGRDSEITVRGSTWGPEEKIVLLNIDNQRVDSQLGKLDPKAIDGYNKRAAKRKVCTRYHLDNRCSAGSSCTYSHGPRLEAGELDVLRMKVRQTVCQHGSECRSRNCYYGHMCTQIYCTRGNECRFSRFHGISRDAITVYSGLETDSSSLTGLSTDDSSDAISTTEDLGGPSAEKDTPKYEARPSILAPRNPNVPEEQDQSKIEESREAADFAYVRYFERRKNA